jgi:hypothetical protein
LSAIGNKQLVCLSNNEARRLAMCDVLRSWTGVRVNVVLLRCTATTAHQLQRELSDGEVELQAEDDGWIFHGDDGYAVTYRQTHPTNLQTMAEVLAVLEKQYYRK